MPAKAANLYNDDGLSDYDVENYQRSLRWSVWAFDLALDALTLAVSDLADEVKADPEYGQRIFAIYQMLLVERAGSIARELFTVNVVERMHATLLLAGLLPAGDPLATPINYDHVPPSYGIDRDDINTLRPVLPLSV